MSSDRYSAEQMSGAHLDQPRTPAEQRLISMTSDQRREYIDQMDHALAVSEHNAKEAKIQAQVDAATAVSLEGNPFYQNLLRGQSSSQRVTVQDGVMTHTQLNQRGNLTNHDFTAPQALVDQLPVTIGGIQLGPQQAKEMMERGEIRADAYYAALDKELSDYGYKSFRKA